MRTLASVARLAACLALWVTILGAGCAAPSPHAAPLSYTGVPTVPKRFDSIFCFQGHGPTDEPGGSADILPVGSLNVTAEGIEWIPVRDDRIRIPWTRVTGVMWIRLGTTPEMDHAVIYQQEGERTTMLAFAPDAAWIFKTLKYAGEVLGGVEPMSRRIGFASGWVECHGTTAVLRHVETGDGVSTSFVTTLESKAPDPIHITALLTAPDGHSETRSLTLGPRAREQVTHPMPSLVADADYILTVDVYQDAEHRVLVDRNRQVVSFTAAGQSIVARSSPEVRTP